MVSSKSFTVNPKQATCGVKSYRKDGFQKKCLNHSITLLQKSSGKRDAQQFRYFGYKKSIEKFQRYQKKRAFHLNKAHYLKSYMEVVRIQIRSYNTWNNMNILPIEYAVVKKIFQSKFVRLVYRSHGLVESNRVLQSLVFPG